MVNEDRVKIMTKMAMYEKNEGAEDISVSTYYKKDYMSLKVLVSLIWVTFGYVIALLVFGVSFVDEIMDHLSVGLLIILAAGVIAGYCVLLLVYGMGAYHFYQEKFIAARKRVKKFNHMLTRLNKMYEKERE